MRQSKKRSEKWPVESIDELKLWTTTQGRIWTVIPSDELPAFNGLDRQKLQAEFAVRATRIFWLTVIGKEMDRRALLSDAKQSDKKGV